MIEFLSHLLTPVILIYVVAAMLALGLSQTVKQIFDSLRNIRITASAIVASYIILPLMAASISTLFALDPGLRFGLVLMSMAAGAEIGPLLTANSNGNVRLAGGLLVISIAITIIYLPAMLGVFLPEVKFPLGHLLIKLSLTVVAPLIVGFLIKWRFEKVADIAEKYVYMVSRIFVMILTVMVILMYYRRILDLFGTYAIIAAFLYVIAGFAIGYLLGYPERGTKLAMGYMHGARNASVAIMVANDVFHDQVNVMLMIALVVILMLLLLIPLSFILKMKPADQRKLPASNV